MLEFFYQNKPKARPNPRLAEVEGRCLVIGPFGCGKKSLALHFCQDLDSLFIDCDDLRFDALAFSNLPQFLAQNPQIQALIISFGSRQIDESLQTLLLSLKLPVILLLSELKSSAIAGFKVLHLGFLSYEEYLSFNKRSSFALNLVSEFLNHQNLSQELLLAKLSSQELAFLKAMAAQIARPTSILKLHRSSKLPKDKTFLCAKSLMERGLIFFSKHRSKALKKPYFIDFSLRNTLSISRSFGALFENTFLCELLRFDEEIFYDKNLDFYLPNKDIGFLCAAFADEHLMMIKINKNLHSYYELGLSELFIITLNTSFSRSLKRLKITALPFHEYVHRL